MAASAMLWVPRQTAGAWSTSDGAVAVFGGTQGDHSQSVAVDSSGNVSTTGYFQRTVDFARQVGQVVCQVGWNRPVGEHDRELAIVQRHGLPQQGPPRGLELVAWLEHADNVPIDHNQTILERDLERAVVGEFESECGF